MRLGIICDFAEEGWPSMDLAADMLIEGASKVCDVARIQPGMIRAARRWSRTTNPWPRTVDRALGRYVQYPAHLLVQRQPFDAFHIVDHSYAHLALTLPNVPIGIFCHDVDAFAARHSGSSWGWRKALAGILTKGMRRAARVFFTTTAVRDEIVRSGLASEENLVHAPMGVSPEFETTEDEHDKAWKERRPYVLHVGSLIPRKNPELLLRLFSELAALERDTRFVQIGGEWTPDLLAQAQPLGERLIRARGLSRAELAAAYRQAAFVVLPSLAEGFGIPVIEALACGTAVIASDIPSLREVGGDAVTLLPPRDFPGWLEASRQALLADPAEHRTQRRNQGMRYSWERHVKAIVGAYESLND